MYAASNSKKSGEHASMKVTKYVIYPSKFGSSKLAETNKYQFFRKM